MSLQRSRRPKTTERSRGRGTSASRASSFNEAVVRRRRRGTARRDRDVWNRVPSTKPSSEDDGERSAASRPSPVGPPSTKPSSEDDGETDATQALQGVLNLLQRSRRPKTTERPEVASMGPSRRDALQRSRRPKTTESTRDRLAACTAPESFNEAVVRRRRRGRWACPTPRSRSQPSTKPSSEDDGEGLVTAQALRRHLPSTKPSSEDDGEIPLYDAWTPRLMSLQRSRRPKTTERVS